MSQSTSGGPRGTEGDTSYFTITSSGSEKWDRSDELGFVMVVKKMASQTPYYVQRNSAIIVSDNQVTDHGRVVTPLG